MDKPTVEEAYENFPTLDEIISSMTVEELDEFHRVCDDRHEATVAALLAEPDDFNF